MPKSPPERNQGDNSCVYGLGSIKLPPGGITIFLLNKCTKDERKCFWSSALYPIPHSIPFVSASCHFTLIALPSAPSPVSLALFRHQQGRRKGKNSSTCFIFHKSQNYFSLFMVPVTDVVVVG